MVPVQISASRITRSTDQSITMSEKVDYCSGAVLATPRDLFVNLGTFDNRYRPAYYEDSDYCFTLRSHGYSVYYQPESVVIHVEGATSGTDLSSGAKKNLKIINRTKFVDKWAHVLREHYSPPDDYGDQTLLLLAHR